MKDSSHVEKHVSENFLPRELRSLQVNNLIRVFGNQIIANTCS